MPSARTGRLRRYYLGWKLKTGRGSMTRLTLRETSREIRWAVIRRRPERVLTSFPLKFSKRRLLDVPCAAHTDPSPRKKPTTRVRKRLRIVDVIRQKRAAAAKRSLLEILPRRVETRKLLWKILQSSCGAAVVYGGSLLAKSLSNGSWRLPSCSAVWPASLSVGLGVMLLTRAHVSYARHLQAQNVLHDLLNQANDAMRLAMAGLTSTVEQRRFGKWIVVFAHALRGVLTQCDVVHDDLCDVLTPCEFFAVVECKNRVALSLQVLTDIVSKHCIDMYLASSLTTALDTLSHSASVLTRLAQPDATLFAKYTPARVATPQLRGRYCERAVGFWASTFPCLTAASSGVWSIPLTLLGASLLCASEEAIAKLETPLAHLPLEDFSRAMKESVFDIQLDYTHIRRISPHGGFGHAYGSNVLPMDQPNPKPGH